MEEPTYGIQDPYLTTLDLSTYEHRKLYNKEIAGQKKVTGMISPDISGLTSTKNWIMLYPHLDSNQ